LILKLLRHGVYKAVRIIRIFATGIILPV
jgi:hypothetical protein